MGMTANSLKKSIMGQLQARGADIPVFVEIVDRYISFWKTSQALQKDIDDRGVMISEMNSVGAEVVKPNPSIKELQNTNKQMLSIQKSLDLDPNKIASLEKDEL